MPIYEYECKSCGEHFEKLVRSMSSADPVKCPECDSSKTARALSVFAVKGDGAPKRDGGSAGPGCGRCGGPNPCGLD